MTEPPLAAVPQASMIGPPEAPGRRAGVAVMVTGGLFGSVVLGQLVPLVYLLFFYVSPLLFMLHFDPRLYAVLAALLVILGLAVLRGSRGALVASVILLGVEAVPPLLGAVLMSSGFELLVVRGLLLAYLVRTLRSWPKSVRLQQESLA